MAPMLSVIIPVYNGEKYLSEAVQSVLAQPCDDLEMIIIDDGSKDASGAIADALAGEHENIHVYHIPNGGVAAARNLGITKAAGQYIAFLDADDILCRDVYTEELHRTMDGGAYDIFSFSHLKSMDNLRWGNLQPAEDGVFQREDSEYIRQTWKHFCSYIYRRSLFDDEVCFPVGIRYHEDVCFLFLIVRKARNIMQSSEPWFIYRMNFNSVMHNLRDAEFILEEIKAWKWCMERCHTDKDRSDCEGNIYEYMSHYIMFSCGYGKPAEDIIRTVKENLIFREVMEHYGRFWINAKKDAFYRAFMEDPGKLWLKYRCIGLARSAVGRLIRTRLGSVINQKVRYRLRLDAYLPVR